MIFQEKKKEFLKDPPIRVVEVYDANRSTAPKTMKTRPFLLALTIGSLALTTFHGLAQSTYEPYTFITLAGETVVGVDIYPYYGSTDGTGTTARFANPLGVAADSAGNVYVADSGNNIIRKGYPATIILNSGPGFGFDPDGSEFGFNLAGPGGQSMVVEISTDLVSWLPIWTNSLGGELHFSDPLWTNYPIRLYRLRAR